tara:strand:- start:18 stop:323 length:306 start_codon:yes stop_codon:yes gene_type:complete
MRQETQKIMSAFLKGEKASAQRTNTDGKSVWLHGNKIAHRGDHFTWFTLAGWPTVTTRDRVNGLLKLSGSDYRVCQRNLRQYLLKDGEAVRELGDSEWVSV